MWVNVKKIPKWIKRSTLGTLIPIILSFGMVWSLKVEVDIVITVFFGSWIAFTVIFFGIMLLYELRDID